MSEFHNLGAHIHFDVLKKSKLNHGEVSLHTLPLQQRKWFQKSRGSSQFKRRHLPPGGVKLNRHAHYSVPERSSSISPSVLAMWRNELNAARIRNQITVQARRRHVVNSRLRSVNFLTEPCWFVPSSSAPAVTRDSSESGGGGERLILTQNTQSILFSHASKDRKKERIDLFFFFFDTRAETPSLGRGEQMHL